jgi:hypothetical protein
MICQELNVSDASSSHSGIGIVIAMVLLLWESIHGLMAEENVKLGTISRLMVHTSYKLP